MSPHSHSLPSGRDQIRTFKFTLFAHHIISQPTPYTQESNLPFTITFFIPVRAQREFSEVLLDGLIALIAPLFAHLRRSWDTVAPPPTPHTLSLIHI